MHWRMVGSNFLGDLVKATWLIVPAPGILEQGGSGRNRLASRQDNICELHCTPAQHVLSHCAKAGRSLHVGGSSAKKRGGFATSMGGMPSLACVMACPQTLVLLLLPRPTTGFVAVRQSDAVHYKSFCRVIHKVSTAMGVRLFRTDGSKSHFTVLEATAVVFNTVDQVSTQSRIQRPALQQSRCPGHTRNRQKRQALTDNAGNTRWPLHHHKSVCQPHLPDAIRTGWDKWVICTGKTATYRDQTVQHVPVALLAAAICHPILQKG